MADISPELLDRIIKDFDQRREDSAGLKRLKKQLEDGEATYKEADQYAVVVGDMLAKSYAANLRADVLPDGKMYYNIANAVVRPTLELDHDIIAEYAAAVQKLLNESAGLGLNAVVPEVDQNRIQGILDRLAGAENYDSVAWILGEPVRNFSQNVVDESARLNFEYQSKSGLSPKIIRTAEPPGIRTVKRGKKSYKYKVPCDWCAGLAGEYDYNKVKQKGHNVYRRHEGCRCIVEYSPDGVKRQNVHTKQWTNDASDDILKMRREYDPAELLLAPTQREFIAALEDFPNILETFTPQTLYNELVQRGFDVLPLGRGHFKGVPFESGGGYKINYRGDGVLQYHPEKYSRHGGAYYKISNSTNGTRRYDMQGQLLVMQWKKD